MVFARKLRRRAFRDRERAFVVEGPLAVAEALRSPAIVRDVFVADDGADAREIRDLAQAGGVSVVSVTGAVIEALSSTSTPRGVVAVVDAPDVSPADVVPRAGLALILAQVRDPGNAGTLLRSAVAAGADTVVFTSGAVDPLHPKTVRASAGALFHVPVVRGVSLEDAVAALRPAGFAIVGADARRADRFDRVDLTRPVALVLGNEAWGIGASDHLLDDAVGIPMPGSAESLNVAVAGSILLFEAIRRRREAVGVRG